MAQRKYEDFPEIGKQRMAEQPEKPPAMVVIDVGNPAQTMELLKHKLDKFDEDRMRIRMGLADENMAPMKSAAATRDLLLTSLGVAEATIIGMTCILGLMTELPGILQNVVVETMMKTGVLKPQNPQHPAAAAQKGFEEAKNNQKESPLILPAQYRRRVNGF